MMIDVASWRLDAVSISFVLDVLVSQYTPLKPAVQLHE